MADMPDQPPIRIVDSRRSAFVSFAPPDPAGLGPRGRTPARAPIPVGPGRAPIAEPSRDRADVGAGVTYPIQAGKIQPPNLRDETLARTRLLDWLDVKIHRRLVYVIADAGYGKTTLLADFSRRTRLRTLWYRLDEEDRDWVGFLAHLVASGREHDPAFAPRTASILRSLEPGGPTREDAIETFIEELPAIATDGAALILDDFHLADEVSDIRTIAREIVARGPERLSIVFASRRPPSVPVSKLRSLGELAELGIADLRFSEQEMEQLFRETYGRPLEPDVLAELARRTEGWAASLTLVQAALRERTPAETRSFVRGLSGARDELHDYLAEEVVGDLPVVQQQFLMRTSLLQRVTPELAQVVTGLDASEVQSMITEAERLGLLGRRARRRSAEQRYHPLVREFLEDRLRKEIGGTGIDELHIAVARWAEALDWRTAGYHYTSAREVSGLARVLQQHLQTIVATGAFASASEYLAAVGETPPSVATEVIHSRIANSAGMADAALHHARRALSLDPSSAIAISNLATSAVLAGDMALAVELADRLREAAQEETLQGIATGIKLMAAASLGGNLAETAEYLERFAASNRERGHVHYEGVSLLNAALIYRARGRASDVLAAASSAVDILRESSSGSELISAMFIQAWAYAWLGELSRAREILEHASLLARNDAKAEFLFEVADLEGSLGTERNALLALSAYDALEAPQQYEEVVKPSRAMLAMRLGRTAEASELLAQTSLTTPTPEPARGCRILALKACVAAVEGHFESVRLARDAIDLAERQGADAYGTVAKLALGAATGQLNSALLEVPERLLPAVSIAAEVVIPRIDSLDSDALGVVAAAAGLQGDRWRDALRRHIRSQPAPAVALGSARLLEAIGDLSDVSLLREVAKRGKTPADRGLGRSLARRLAPRAVIHDLGRVRVDVGGVEVPTSSVRRKVLSLLCFLLTRPRMSATREEVMEGLWPEFAPSAAANSLNQTIYFLRRIFEPEYDDDTSPGYVRQESDTVFLDTDLVTSTSTRCAVLIDQIDRGGPAELVDELSRTYSGRFAIDFAYEEWAADYRDWLHVAYLQVIERAIATGIEAGAFAETVPLARRALEAEPRLDSLSLSLLKLLKGAGAHAAAAEQYERYASLLRTDIGVDPPPFEAL